jgi:isopentenyl-diphosphate Delta-isomerase
MKSADEVANELLPVVNENDEVVGTSPRGVIHAQGLLHRAVHILVFRSDGSVYLQQRSLIKDCSPGKWDSSCSGHVDPGESYQDSAHRELKEELGLDVEACLRPIGKLPATPATGMEFTQIYSMESDKEPVPNPSEIMDGMWIQPEALDAWIREKSEPFALCFLEVWRFFRQQGT